MKIFACFFIVLLSAGCHTIHSQQSQTQHVVSALLSQPTLPEKSDELPPAQIPLTSDIKPIQKTVKAVQSSALASKNTEQKAANLWLHIANHLTFNVTLTPEVRTRVDWYLAQPNYLTIVNNRAAPFLYHIVQKVEQHNLPMEIALLPFVESDFRLNALSQREAAGVWQLLADTAYHFGTVQNAHYDGRLDVMSASDAALEYLMYLHRQFNGDWLHALAAYNSGETRVRKAIQRNRRNNIGTSFEQLSLPEETSEYVPKILALSYLLQTRPTQFKLPFLKNAPITSEFNVNQQFDFTVIAGLLNIPPNKLHALNPGYLNHRSPLQGPHTLLLPLTPAQLNEHSFFRNLDSLEHTVKKNDTLYKIARVYKTTVAKLKILNQLENNIIRLNQKLVIKQKQFKPNSLIVDNQVSPYVARAKVKPLELEPFTHKVQSGETLWSISRDYNIRMKDLISWNKIKKQNSLALGSEVTIMRPKRPTLPTLSTQPDSTHYLKQLKQLVKPEVDRNDI